MTTCPTCNGKGGMTSTTDYLIDQNAGTTEQNTNNQTQGINPCSTCNGKGYLVNFGVV